MQVTITTSSPNDLVMHWGVSKQNDKSWVLPPKAVWSPVAGSVADAGGAVPCALLCMPCLRLRPGRLVRRTCC